MLDEELIPEPCENALRFFVEPVLPVSLERGVGQMRIVARQHGFIETGELLNLAERRAFQQELFDGSPNVIG